MNKSCKRENKQSVKFEKVLQKNGNRLYVKWKGNDSSFEDLLYHKYHKISCYFLKQFESYKMV